MDEVMTNKIVDICKSAFFDKTNAKDRSEYIKNKLDDLYPNIQWSVFLYTNGYCKVSFDKNYIIFVQRQMVIIQLFLDMKKIISLNNFATWNILIKDQLYSYKIV